jgi:hypothetical protein
MTTQTFFQRNKPVLIATLVIVASLAVIGTVLVLLARDANAPLTQGEYVSRTQDAGFTVQDPAQAYSAAKLLCLGKKDADFETNVRALVTLATLQTPKTEDQISTYVSIVRDVC